MWFSSSKQKLFECKKTQKNIWQISYKVSGKRDKNISIYVKVPTAKSFNALINYVIEYNKDGYNTEVKIPEDEDRRTLA